MHVARRTGISRFDEIVGPNSREVVLAGIAPGALTDDAPNVPTIAEIARTEEQRQLLRYGVYIPSQFTRPFAVAPGVPAERVRALREAFMRTLADEEFLAAAEKGKLT